LARLRSAPGRTWPRKGAEAGEVRRTLRLRYDGADAELPVTLSGVATAKAAFEAAHQRLFGFVEPERTILIAAVEAEAQALILDGGGLGGGVAAEEPQMAQVGAGAYPRSSPHLTAHTTIPDPSSIEEEGRVRMFALGTWHGAPVVGAEALSTIDGPALVIRPDTQIAVLPGWRATAAADGLIRLTRTSAAAQTAIALDKPDPVTLELFNRRFMGVAEAMGAALERTAHSVNIKERLDFSCALFDADGGLVANAPHMPVHLGSMGASVRAVRDRHPQLKAGQAFALNNPYAGGTHLPDITVVMPVFMDAADAQASFYVAARGHHADVGGIQPGSMPPFSRTIDEEGVMLDALPIMAGGRFLDADVRAALAAGPWPARAPERNVADLKAQVAACQAGAAAVAEMIRAYGAQAVARYMGFVQENAAEAVRRAVGKLHDGAARAPIDGGGEIVVTTTVDAAARTATLDFTASSDQLDSNFNGPSAIVDAAALYVFRTLVDDDIPLNAGCLEPLKILTRGRLAAEPASARRRGRRQRRDQPAPRRLPLCRARRHGQRPGHDEQLHLRRRRPAVLRDHLRRRGGDRDRRGRQRCPHPHDQFAPDRSGDPGAALPGAGGGLRRAPGLGRRGRSSRRRRDRTAHPLPGADGGGVAFFAPRERPARAGGRKSGTGGTAAFDQGVGRG
jgi:5-oxoprolinase (ATP-hydrolysing)